MSEFEICHRSNAEKREIINVLSPNVIKNLSNRVRNSIKMNPIEMIHNPLQMTFKISLNTFSTLNLVVVFDHINRIKILCYWLTNTQKYGMRLVLCQKINV